MELTAHGGSNGLAQRCLSDTRGTHKADDGSLQITFDLNDREILNDTLLDMIKTKVILF